MSRLSIRGCVIQLRFTSLIFYNILKTYYRASRASDHIWFVNEKIIYLMFSRKQLLMIILLISCCYYVAT